MHGKDIHCHLLHLTLYWSLEEAETSLCLYKNYNVYPQMTCVQNPKKSTIKLLWSINAFNKNIVYRLMYKKSNLAINNWKL